MTETFKKKRGRPKGTKSDNPARKTLSNVRVTDQQLEAYKTASEREKKTFSAWVRDALDEKSSINNGHVLSGRSGGQGGGTGIKKSS